MSPRETIRGDAVEAACRRLNQAYWDAGYPRDRALRAESERPAVGRAWRLYDADGLPVLSYDGFLGLSARDARDALVRMAEVVEHLRCSVDADH